MRVDAEKALSGQVALITGASRGIGLAIARTFGRMGARLALAARDKAKLEAAAAELRREAIEAVAVPTDVSRPADVTAAVERTNQALGEISILVNNAGFATFRPAHEASEAEWDSILDTNLKGVFLMSRAVAPQMIRRRGGFIVNIASLAGKNAFANGGIYCASKWGLLGLTFCMAEDLRGEGIRVTAICPGSVATEFSAHPGKDVSKMLQADDVAHAAAMIVTAAPQSFISEVLMRPTQKP